MKEFALEKEYEYGTPQSTMKRLANRIKKAYIEVAGHYSEFLDEHLAAIAKMEETDFELEDTFVTRNEHSGHCVYDRIKSDYEYYIRAMMSTNEYGEARFDRELTAEECAKYGLKPDNEWEQEKTRFFEMLREYR